MGSNPPSAMPTPPSGGGTGTVATIASPDGSIAIVNPHGPTVDVETTGADAVVAGTGIIVDSTNPKAPIVATQGGAARVVAAAPATIPTTVVATVNDEFEFGAPAHEAVYTVTAGVYNSAGALAAAMNAATSSPGHPLSALVIITNNNGTFIATAATPGIVDNSYDLLNGVNDFLSATGFTSGQALSGGGGLVSCVTSLDGSVTITDPVGPTVDLHVASSAGYGADDFPEVTAYFGVGDGNNIPYENDSLLLLSAKGAHVGELYDSLVSLPSLISPSGNPVLNQGVQIAGVDTTTDGFTLVTKITVTDQLGTNVLTVNRSDHCNQVGPGQSVTTNYGACTVNQLVGADLTYSNAQRKVISTAGGIFTVILSYHIVWD